MKAHFNKHIEGLDLQFWKRLIMDYGEFVSFDRGECLCRRGEPSRRLGFVEAGYFRYEVGYPPKIGGFAFAGALVGDYPGVMYDEPACINIRAGKPSAAWLMDATLMPELADSDVVVAHHLRILSEQVYRSLFSRYYDMYAKSPDERYRHLLDYHPQLIQDVPLKEIASYLRISQVHLCRIRKGVLQ
ncbi:MAG: hypothetical protein K2L49_08905 [Muribaculaceae bacterium]|nr:hypothetical protein [Muribaculaceae bacterium]